MDGKEYNGWEFEDNTLTRDFQFKNFKEALAFVNVVGTIAEQENHHPDIIMFDYNCVSLITKTHDANDTVTKKDFDLVDKINSVL
ncbi:MAG: 4a-hydroxytetrahydrobiopterin dehydratase [Lishizhenia sp.]